MGNFEQQPYPELLRRISGFAVHTKSRSSGTPLAELVCGAGINQSLRHLNLTQRAITSPDYNLVVYGGDYQAIGMEPSPTRSRPFAVTIDSKQQIVMTALMTLYRDNDGREVDLHMGFKGLITNDRQLLWNLFQQMIPGLSLKLVPDEVKLQQADLEFLALTKIVPLRASDLSKDLGFIPQAPSVEANLVLPVEPRIVTGGREEAQKLVNSLSSAGGQDIFNIIRALQSFIPGLGSVQFAHNTYQVDELGYRMTIEELHTLVAQVD